MSKGWIGVDLDGTLAQYDRWRGKDHIGEPIPAMLERVKRWLAEGKEVRICTARVNGEEHPDAYEAFLVIQDWCVKHIGQALIVTASKNGSMIELWDDRVVTVEKNTGRRLSPSRFESE